MISFGYVQIVEGDRTDNNETLVLLAEKALNWHLCLVKLNESCSSCGGVACLDQLGLHSVVSGHEDDRESLVSLAAYNEVVTEHAVGNPLLGTTNDVVLAIRC